METEEMKSTTKVEIDTKQDYTEVQIDSSEETVYSVPKRSSNTALYGMLVSVALLTAGFFVIDPAIRGAGNPEMNPETVKEYLHSATFVALTWLVMLVTLVSRRYQPGAGSEVKSLGMKNAVLRKEMTKMEREKLLLEKSIAAKEFEKTLEMESLHEKYKTLMEKKDMRCAALEMEKNSFKRELDTLRVQMQSAQQKSDTLAIKNQLLKEEKQKGDWKFLEKFDLMHKDQQQMRAKYDEIVSFVKTQQIDQRGEPDFWTNLQKWMQKAMQRKHGLNDVLVELKKQEKVRKHKKMKKKQQGSIVDDLWALDDKKGKPKAAKKKAAKKKAPMEDLWDFETS